MTQSQLNVQLGSETGPPASLAAPSMPESVILYLTDCLRQATCYVEFGAGGSTLLAARLGVPDIISVESDAGFLDSVVREAENIDGPTRLHGVYVDIGATGPWGRPLDAARFTSWHSYAQQGFRRARKLDLEPDLVLIDGRFRVACFLATLLCARPGTRVVFDDYAERRKYHFVERFAKPERLVDRTAVFLVPAELDPVDVAFALAHYSVVPK